MFLFFLFFTSPLFPEYSRSLCRCSQSVHQASHVPCCYLLVCLCINSNVLMVQWLDLCVLQLAYCVVQFLEKDSTLTEPVCEIRLHL